MTTSERTACRLHLQGPGGAAAGVAGRLVRNENRAPERHGIAVVQNAIDLRRRVSVLR